MIEPPRKITLKMIAEAAGTSIGTVDRALNNRIGISEERKAQILAVAEELGYRPNKFASALGRKKALRIGLAYPVNPKEFYCEIDRGVDQAAEELTDYGVTLEKIRFDVQDPEIALAQMRSSDVTHLDGLAINSAGSPIEQLIDDYMNSGLPVITFNTDAPESKRLFYVGSNSRLSGFIAGELMHMLLRGQGNITALGNFARITPFVDRFGGFCEFLQREGSAISMFPCPDCRSDPDLAAEILMDMFRRMPDLAGVFCTGYSTTVGAVQALKKLDRRDITLIGYDVTPRTGEALEAGWCSALLYQEPAQQGYLAAHLLARHLIEGWLPENPRQYVETQIVLKSNLSSYLQPASALTLR